MVICSKYVIRVGFLAWQANTAWLVFQSAHILQTGLSEKSAKCHLTKLLIFLCSVVRNLVENDQVQADRDQFQTPAIGGWWPEDYLDLYLHWVVRTGLDLYPGM